MAQFESPEKIVADYNAAHPEVNALDEESVEYYTKLAQPTLADRASDAAQGDVFDRASQNFKDKVASQGVGGNIHSVTNSEIKIDNEAAKKQLAAAPSDPSFNAADLETDVGLTPGALDKLGITDHDTAREAIQGIAQATANAATDDDVEQLVASWDGEPALEALRQRINSAIDGFASPKFGNTANLDSVQAVERAKLLNHALKQNIGLAKNNLNSVSIETLLRRARFATDPDFRGNPARNQGSGGPPQRDPNAGFRSIHHAFQNNPS